MNKDYMLEEFVDDVPWLEGEFIIIDEDEAIRLQEKHQRKCKLIKDKR